MTVYKQAGREMNDVDGKVIITSLGINVHNFLLSNGSSSSFNQNLCWVSFEDETENKDNMIRIL